MQVVIEHDGFQNGTSSSSSRRRPTPERIAKQNLSDILSLLEDLTQAPAHVEWKVDGSFGRLTQVGLSASKLGVDAEHAILSQNRTFGPPECGYRFNAVKSALYDRGLRKLFQYPASTFDYFSAQWKKCGQRHQAVEDLLRFRELCRYEIRV